MKYDNTETCNRIVVEKNDWNYNVTLLDGTKMVEKFTVGHLNIDGIAFATSDGSKMEFGGHKVTHRVSWTERGGGNFELDIGSCER